MAARHWTPLKGSTTTDQDPQGHNYGNGFTGVSGAPGVDTGRGTRGQWVEEQIDLTPYAGKQSSAALLGGQRRCV